MDQIAAAHAATLDSLIDDDTDDLAGLLVPVRDFLLALPDEGPLAVLVAQLRDEHRIKRNVDYAIQQKYGSSYLLCTDVFLPTILRAAEAIGLTFATVTISLVAAPAAVPDVVAVPLSAADRESLLTLLRAAAEGLVRRSESSPGVAGADLLNRAAVLAHLQERLVGVSGSLPRG